MLIYTKYLMLGITIGLGTFCFAQKSLLTTTTGMLADQMQAQPKPILLLVSTQWCKFCRLQKAQIQKNPLFTAYNKEFYFVEIDAESNEDILFNGQIYSAENFGNDRGIHGLVRSLTENTGSISYPFWIILDQKYQVLLRRNGLFSPKELNRVIEILTTNPK